MLALRTPSGQIVASKSWPLASRTGAMSFVNPEQSLMLLGGINASYAEIWKTQPWVRAICNKLTKAFARLPLKAYTRTPDGSREEQFQGPITKLIRSPYPRAGTFQMNEFLLGSCMVYGNATFVKFRGKPGRTPTEIWPMPFDRVQILEGSERPIEAYIWTPRNGGRPKVFLPEDVLHFYFWNAEGNPWGISPLESLKTTLALEDAGQRYAISSFGNAARPASFIVSEKKLNKEQREELRAEINSAYAGPDNAFKIALLDNGLDWKPIAMSAQETEQIANRKLSREEVCAVYDLSPPLIGILDSARNSDTEELHEMLYVDSIEPMTVAYADLWNAQLIYPEPAWDGGFVDYDLNAVMRGNIEKRSQAYQRFLLSGVKTPNELRRMEGDPPHGDLDNDQNPANWLYVPVNTAPIDGEGQIRPIAQQPGHADPAADPAGDPTPDPLNENVA